jgi:hypothetical protein
MVDSMAETAFAQGDVNWETFEYEMFTDESHSEWEEYYSDGGFWSEEDEAPVPSSGAHNKTKEGAEGKVGEVGSGDGVKGGVRRGPVLKRRRVVKDGGGGKEVTVIVPSPVEVKGKENGGIRGGEKGNGAPSAATEGNGQKAEEKTKEDGQKPKRPTDTRKRKPSTEGTEALG